ncbi:MAG: hypothetical protein ACI934_000401 [Pseudohongiellaceae bacterium]|jgi:hypothetical protein
MAEPQKPVGPVSLTSTAHKGVHIRDIGNTDHIAPNHFAKIYTPEFVKAGTDYPIIFVKDPETGTFFAAVMWGLEPGENLFIEDGVWKGGYFPASVRCYPFAVQPDPETNDRLFIGIYENASVLNMEEGNLIFNDDGTETAWMLEVKEFLVRVFQQEEMTKQFVNKLNELELLVPQSLSIKNSKDDSTHDVSGFYIVDREKLANLSDETFLELRKSGALEVIYNHIMSLESLDKLLRKKQIKAPSTPPGSAAG